MCLLIGCIRNKGNFRLLLVWILIIELGSSCFRKEFCEVVLIFEFWMSLVIFVIVGWCNSIWEFKFIWNVLFKWEMNWIVIREFLVRLIKKLLLILIFFKLKSFC